MERFRPHMMLVAAALVYGAFISVHKLAGEAGIAPIAYGFWQSLGAGSVLLALSFATGGPPGRGAVHLRAYLVIGAFAIGLPVSLLSYVAPNLPVSILTLVLTMSPPMTYALGLLTRIERWRWPAVVGIGLGLTGVAVIVVPDAAMPEPGMSGWFLLALLAPLMFATANVSAAILRPPALSSVAMASGVFFGSACVQALAMAITGQTYWFANFPSATDGFLLAAIVINSIFVSLYLEIVRLAGPVFFAQFNYLAVLTGIGWGWLIFSDPVSPLVWIAFALMALGVVLITKRSPKRSANA
jgi:drug/metabolite transporter (DMT)-like permease